MRYAPADFQAPLYLAIYGQRVAFITSKKEQLGFIVQSADFSTTMKSLFDTLWKVSMAE